MIELERQKTQDSSDKKQSKVLSLSEELMNSTKQKSAEDPKVALNIENLDSSASKAHESSKTPASEEPKSSEKLVKSAENEVDNDGQKIDENDDKQDENDDTLIEMESEMSVSATTFSVTTEGNNPFMSIKAQSFMPTQPF